MPGVFAAEYSGKVALPENPPTTRTDLNLLIGDYIASHSIPGVSVAIANGGVLLHAAGYGLANVELKAPATADTVYQLASVGKQFTAALVLLLSERGLLGLDDRIAPHFDSPPDAWARITVRHLLTHTSGISDEGWSRLDLRLDYTDADLVQAVASAPVTCEPGSRWCYSNSGYILLGILIARITGRFYGDLLDEWIFRPLGMATARVNSDADIIANRTAGYRLENGVLKNQEYVSPSINRTADGGLCASVLDLASWDGALHTGEILSAAACEAMWTPVQLEGGNVYGYGFGWSISTSPHGRIVEHDGEWQGFSSHLVRYLDDGLMVVVLANLADADATELAHSIAAARLPETPKVRLRPYQPGDAAAFRALNEAWIVRHFTLEEEDRVALGDPEGHILRPGGHIYMALSGAIPVGCCALIPIRPGVFELAKMCVSEEYRGRGLGRRILEHTIAQAKALRAETLFLASNSVLANAVHLYEALGFRHVPRATVPASPYARSNVFMELQL